MGGEGSGGGGVSERFGADALAAAAAEFAELGLMMIFLTGCCAPSWPCFLVVPAFGRVPRGAIFSVTPYRINPASSKLGLLWTAGSNHFCKKVFDAVLGAFDDFFAESLPPLACWCGLENRDLVALVLVGIMSNGLFSPKGLSAAAPDLLALDQTDKRSESEACNRVSSCLCRGKGELATSLVLEGIR